MDGVIPARGGKSRDMLDSVFLLAYARRIEMRAKWMLTTYAFWGAVVGFGMGSAIVAVHGFAEMFGAGGGLNLGALLGHPAPVAAEAIIWVYLPWMAAAVGAVMWGARGLGKSDEMRFQAQMALHVLKLQELALMEKNHG